MSNEDNEDIIYRMVKMIADGRREDAKEIFSATWMNHDSSLPLMVGVEGARQFLSMWHEGFPNAHITIENIVSDDEMVAARFSFRGQNTGSFMGMPATGNSIDITGTGIFRLEDGKLMDSWMNFDLLGLMQQLGATVSLDDRVETSRSAKSGYGQFAKQFA